MSEQPALRQIALAVAALSYAHPVSLAHIECTYYDGWHPIASDGFMRPNGLNKLIEDNLPTEGAPTDGYGYDSRLEALAAAAEALGLEPDPLLLRPQPPAEHAAATLPELDALRKQVERYEQALNIDLDRAGRILLEAHEKRLAEQGFARPAETWDGLTEHGRERHRYMAAMLLAEVRWLANTPTPPGGDTDA